MSSCYSNSSGKPHSTEASNAKKIMWTKKRRKSRTSSCKTAIIMWSGCFLSERTKIKIKIPISSRNTPWSCTSCFWTSTKATSRCLWRSSRQLAWKRNQLVETWLTCSKSCRINWIKWSSLKSLSRGTLRNSQISSWLLSAGICIKCCCMRIENQSEWMNSDLCLPTIGSSCSKTTLTGAQVNWRKKDEKNLILSTVKDQASCLRICFISGARQRLQWIKQKAAISKYLLRLTHWPKLWEKITSKSS